MKRMKSVILLVFLCVLTAVMCSGCSQQNNTIGKEPPKKVSQEEKAYTELSVIAAKDIKTDLVMPESIDIHSVKCSVSRFNPDRVIVKMKFSAKNENSGVVDTVLYFEFDKESASYSELYSSMVNVAKAQAGLDATNRAMAILSGSNVGNDPTTIYKKNMFSHASELTESCFNSDEAIDIDVNTIMKAID